jgi:hypothetical protein
MDFEGSLPCSQEPTTDPYILSQLAESSPNPPTLFP